MDVNPNSSYTRRGCQDPQQQLASATALIDNSLEAESGQFSSESASTLSGKRPAEREAGA